MCLVLWITPAVTGMQGSTVITQFTRSAFDAFDALEPGDIVFMSNENAGETWGITSGLSRDIIAHIFSKPGVKLVVASFGSRDGPPIFLRRILTSPTVQRAIEEYNIVYGEDYVVYPYYAGGEQALSLFADNVRSIATADAFGTPTDEIPMMAGVDDGSAFRMIWGVGPTPGLITVWDARYHGDIDIVYSYGAHVMSRAAAFIASGQYTGMVMDLKGGAEYELLMEEAGLFHSGISKESLAVVNLMIAFMIALVVAGNIQWIVNKTMRKG